MPHEPLPDPESEQLAALLGDGTGRLLALRNDWVPSELIGIVASAKEYQTDYEKRTRELRLLGWDYKVRKERGEGARTRVYYRLMQSAPWPENIHAAIVAEEKRRRAAKGKKSTGSDGTQ